MANLLPSGYEYEIIEESDLADRKPIGYRNGSAFDYTIGDYKRDGKNRILDSNGVESWESWCFNAISTERYKHLAYSSDFGIELDKVFAAVTREEKESILTREITECLLADPYGRTEYVEDIIFDWKTPDAVEIHVKIKGIEDVEIDVTAYITR